LCVCVCVYFFSVNSDDLEPPSPFYLRLWVNLSRLTPLDYVARLVTSVDNCTDFSRSAVRAAPELL
jgi:hypothetical protein